MEKIYRVSEITSDIKKLLEQNYASIQIQGEISGLVRSTLGHRYFRLKDENAQISCVLFRFSSPNIELKNGMEVITIGRISLYEKQGNYQLIVQKVQPLGIGELQIKFEELKQKLQKEGIFDRAKKKKIPLFPKKLGLVTSAKGAALQDILAILKRRAPEIEVLIANSLVQGELAPHNLIAAIETLESRDIDVILITRGGGSMEDLWCFNDESLVRKIFASQKPILSAVGHESDFTLCDFVADKRAATPSEAAEILSSNKEDLLEKIQFLQKNLVQTMEKTLSLYSQTLQKIQYQLGNPMHSIQNYLQRLDDTSNRIELAISSKINQQKNQLERVQILLRQNPLPQNIFILRQKVASKQEKIKENFLYLLQGKEKQFLKITNEVQLHHPLNALKQGYARVFSSSGKVIKNIEQVKIQDFIQIQFQTGKIIAEVKKTIPNLLEESD